MTTAPERTPTADLRADRARDPDVPRVLTNVRHGGHVDADDVPAVDPTRRVAVDSVSWAEITRTSTAFGYLFDDLRGDYPGSHLAGDAATVVASLKALGTAMAEQPGDPHAADSEIPPIYTYWGQFVDHDLTANTDRDDAVGITDLPLEPLQPEKVVKDLRNLRQPRLNLDSVYGNGPTFSGQPDQVPYTSDRLAVGTLASGPPDNEVIPGADLPRVDGKARIGDARNDENLVVAQLHLAFLKFHNAVLDWFAANPGSPVTGTGGFDRARQLVEWHYQWVTVHDFLTTIARPDVVDGLLDGTITPRFGLSASTPATEVFMPLEFSVAAYRFGHSMVRSAYDWNANFGFPRTGDPSDPPPTGPSAAFDLLFVFTGNGGFFGAPTLPDNWPAQFERFTGFEPQPAGAADGVPPRVARRIDTHLAPPLGNLFNEATTETSLRIRRILRRLAVRNLLRGYRLALPTGQAVARSLGVPPLTRDELITKETPFPPPFLPSPVDDALIDGGFLEDTPLWFYVLKEAEVREQGQRLGQVGSRIVAETILGQLRADPTSFLNQAWDPGQGVTVGADPVDSIIRFLRFAGMHP